jgi:hypothetical protein
MENQELELCQTGLYNHSCDLLSCHLQTLQTENTVSDSFDLYYGLFMYNVNATEQASTILNFFIRYLGCAHAINDYCRPNFQLAARQPGKGIREGETDAVWSAPRLTTKANCGEGPCSCGCGRWHVQFCCALSCSARSCTGKEASFLRCCCNPSCT